MLAMAAFTSGALTSATASAAGSKKALVLGSSVSGGTSSREYTSLVTLGFTPTVVTEAHWNAMTAAQFGAYQVLVIGDPTCDTVTGSTNRAVWTSVVMGHAGGRTQPGNRVVIGTDPVYHGPSHPGAYTLISDGLKWAGALIGPHRRLLRRQLLERRPRRERPQPRSAPVSARSPTTTARPAAATCRSSPPPPRSPA